MSGFGKTGGPPPQRQSLRLQNKPPEFQPYEPPKKKTGAIGVPGGRKLGEIEKFTPLDFKKLDSELSSILQASKTVRALKKQSPKDYLKKARPLALKVNRKIVYRSSSMGGHSLHVGQDIVAYWNSKKRGTGGSYAYTHIAKSLDKRLNENKEGKPYWKVSGTVNDTVVKRRTLVALGMKKYVSGDQPGGEAEYEKAGLTERGRKWTDKMTSILLAEKGRQVYGKQGKDLVGTALGHVGEKYGFKDVFVTHRKTLAPFAGKGMAKVFAGKRGRESPQDKKLALPEGDKKKRKKE